jgi:drug/metabolite transporter (DMT)-like permease
MAVPLHNPHRPTLRHWAMLLALTAMWGSAFALTKVAVVSLPPELVVLGRLAVAALLLCGLWLLLGRPAPRDRRVWLLFAAIALFGNVLPFTLIAWGQQTIDSGIAGILMAVMPLFTLVFAHLFVPGERINRFRVAGFLLGFTGVAVLMSPQVNADIGWADGELLAMLAVLAGALCYAVSAILSRLQPETDTLVVATATILLAALFMGLWTLPGAALPPVEKVPVPAALAVAGLGVFATAVAATVYFALVKQAGPTFVSQLNYLIPVWAVLLGTTLMDERLVTTDLVAMALILLGILTTHRAPARRPGSAARDAVAPAGRARG